MLSLLRELYGHMAWADALVWRATLGHPAASGDQPLRDKLQHIHLGQHAYLGAWRGVMPELRKSFAEAAAIAQWGREYHDDVPAYLATLDEAALDQPLIIPWAAHFIENASPTTLGQTILQLAMHSTYHRGQVNMRLRELGAQPPLIDYIAWLWMGKPPAEWPS